jgi:hypothetical protein
MEFGGTGVGVLIGIGAAAVVCWLSGPNFDCIQLGAWLVGLGFVGGLLLDWYILQQKK